jgi:hypothetical protein
MGRLFAAIDHPVEIAMTTMLRMNKGRASDHLMIAPGKWFGFPAARFAWDRTVARPRIRLWWT